VIANLQGFDECSRPYKRVFTEANQALVTSENGTVRAKVIMEVLWEFSQLGVIMPANSNDYGMPNWEHIHVTEYGHRYLQDRQSILTNTLYYVQHLESRTAGLPLDETVKFYSGKASECLCNGLFNPAIVMLGVAAERLILVIAEAIKESRDDEGKKLYDRIMRKEWIKTRFTALLQVLREVGSSDVQGDLEGLTGLFHITRKYRNDASHPKDIRFDYHDANGTLESFGLYVKHAYRIIRDVSGSVE
jgi:hypothetical protein